MQRGTLLATGKSQQNTELWENIPILRAQVKYHFNRSDSLSLERTSFPCFREWIVASTTCSVSSSTSPSILTFCVGFLGRMLGLSIGIWWLRQCCIFQLIQLNMTVVFINPGPDRTTSCSSGHFPTHTQMLHILSFQVMKIIFYGDKEGGYSLWQAVSFSDHFILGKEFLLLTG